MLNKMVHGLDAWLWRRGIAHPVVRPLVRNQLLLTVLVLPAGALVYALTPWLFWFGVGLSIMALIFWSWSRFFLRGPLDEYSLAFLRAVLLRWGGRLIVLTGLLYLALIVCHAPPSALLGGVMGGAAVGLATFALAARHN